MLGWNVQKYGDIIDQLIGTLLDLTSHLRTYCICQGPEDLCQKLWSNGALPQSTQNNIQPLVNYLVTRQSS